MSSSPYILKGQIRQLEDKLADLIAHQAQILNGLTIFRWVTLLLYLAFTLSLYVGDVMNIQTLFDSFLGSFIGFALYLLIAVGLAYSLASFKHNFYVYRGIHGGAFAIVIVVIMMGLTAEIFQSSGQQDVKARAGAESSGQYQATLKQSPIAILSQGYADPYADRLIKIEGELAKVREMERTCVKTCSAQRQKIEALEGQIAAVQQLRQQSATKHSTDIASAQERHNQQLNQIEEKHYNPTIRSVKELTGVGLGTAITLIMGLISIIFEICHGYFSTMYNRTLRSTEALKSQLVMLRGQYADLTGTELDPTDPTQAPPPKPTETKAADLNAQPTRPKNLSLSGAVSAFSNDPAAHLPPALLPVFEGIASGLNQTQQERSQFYNNAAKAAADIEKAWDDATTYSAKQAGKPILGTQEQQLRIPEVSTYRTELEAAGIPSPYDPVLEKSADKESIQRIIGRVQAKPTDRPARPDEPTGRLSIEPTEPEKPTDDQIMLKNAQAEIEALKAQNLAIQQRAEREKAELEAKARQQAQADLKARLEQVRAEREAKAEAERIARERAETERQARLQAERERLERDRAAAEARATAERQAREQAEQAARLERERLERERAAAEQRAREQAALAAKAEADRIAREQAEADLKARTEELGRLTEEHVGLAAQVIEQAIKSGRVTSLGFESLKADLKAADLPTSSDSIRRLIKLGCQVLAERGIVAPNPRAGVSGQPNFLIV